MKHLIYISVLALTLHACKKENNAIDFQGTYSGTFKISANSDPVPTEFTLTSPNFTVNKGIKLGSGTFKVENKMIISFADTNVWTAEFDHNILLSGNYRYEALGDSLILTKILTNPDDGKARYQYRLKRIVD